MKKIWIILLVITSIAKLSVSFAQVNLVPNPSFEVFDTCPDQFDQMNRCALWWNAGDPILTTPDYLHTCSSNPNITPPSVSWGYQYPHGGNAYSFVATYNRVSVDYREYIQAQLDQPLIPNQEYYVSFYANLSGEGLITYGTNNLGALFSTYKFQNPNYALPINFAQVYSDSILTDTVNWFHLKGSFIADSAFEYVTIGNFFDDANTDTINIDGTNSFFGGYYIDDVCISSDSALCYTFNSVHEILYQNVFVYPNPADQYILINKYNDSTDTGIILNVLGQTIAKFSAKNGKEVFIDCSRWPEGIYLMKIKNNSYKIIIQH